MLLFRLWLRSGYFPDTLRFLLLEGGGVPEEVSIVISDRTSEFVQRGLTAASILLQLGSLPSFQPDAVWAIEGT